MFPLYFAKDKHKFPRNQYNNANTVKIFKLSKSLKINLILRKKYNYL